MTRSFTLGISNSHFGLKIFPLKAFVAFFLLAFMSTNVQAQFRTRLYANTQTNSVEAKGDVQLLGAVNLTLAQALQQLSIDLADLGSVNNPGNAVDINALTAQKTFSTLSATYLTANINLLGLPIATVKVGALVSQNLGFGSIQAGSNPVTIKLGYGGGLAQTLVDGLAMQATLNGNPVGPVFNKTNSVVGLVGNLSVVEATFAPGVPYDGVRVSISSENQLASLNAFYSVNIYHAYVYQDAATLADCDGPFDVLHGSTAAVSLLGNVTNPFNAIDSDINSFATLNSGANVLSSPADGVSLTSIFPTLSKAGDSVRVVISYPGALLQAQLLSSIAVQAINHNENGTETVVGAATGSSLLSLALLPGSTTRAVVSFSVNQPFNRVKLQYGGVANALQSINIYDIKRNAPKPVVVTPGFDPITNNVTVCAGTPVTLTIQNSEAGSAYVWYKTAVGGVPIADGLGANGNTLTPTNLTVGVNEFYVSVVREGCGNEASARTKATITVNAGPLATDIAVLGNANPYCAGANVTLTPSVIGSPSIPIPNPVFRWYRNADKTGEILTGTSDGGVQYTLANGVLQIAGLAQTVTYYVSVTGNNGAGCESGAGARKAVPVNVKPLATDAEITTNTNVTQCVGQPIVIAPTAPTVVNPVFNYYLDANKTQPLANGYTDGTVVYAITSTGTITISNLPAAASRTFYVTVSGDNFCENATGKPITVTSTSSLLPPTFATSVLNVCGANVTAQFVVTSHIAGLTYAIYDAPTAGNLVTANVGIVDNTITFSNINTSAIYYIEVSGPGGCTSASRSSLEIKYLPNAPAGALNDLKVNGKNMGDICANSDGNFILNAASNGVNNPIYYLYKGINFVESNNTGIFNLAGLIPGVAVTYSVGVSGDNYCETPLADRKSITFTPYLLPGNPAINVTGTKVITLGSTFQLKVDPIPSNTASFQWRKDGVLLTETSATLTVSNADATAVGVYTVVAVSPSGCLSIGSAAVTIKFSDLTFWKSYTTNVGTASVKGSENLIYTIHIKNSAATAKSNYSVADALPANTTLVSIADGGTEVNGVISWNGISIPANGTVTRSFTAKVNANLTGISTIYNIATLDNGTDPQQLSNPADLTDSNLPGDPAQFGTVTPVQNVTSTITWKAASIPNNATAVKGGEEVVYTIYVRNIGNQDIHGLIVRDNLPAHTTFVSVANNGILNGNSLVWSGNSITVGQTVVLNFTIKVDTDLTGVDLIRNIAISNDGINPDQTSIPPDPTDPTLPGDNTKTGTDIPVTKVSDFNAVLSVASANANGLANAGDNLTYTLTVTNTGNQTLTGVTINDPLPANTDFVSASNGGVLNAGNIVYNIPNITPGQSAIVTAIVKVKNDLTGVTSITNTANIVTNEVTKASNQATVQVNQVPNFTTGLTVSSSNANGKANAGDLLAYTLTITNTGDQRLTNIKITDPVPTGTDFVSASNGGVLQGTSVVISLPDLNPGATASVTIEARVKTDLTGLTTISNTASVATTQLTKPAGPADIQVNQVPNFTSGLTVSSSNSNGKANAGDLLTYTLTITNTGDQPLTNIKITDPVPAGTDFVSASNGGVLQGTSVVISLPDLNPGATASLTIEARVKTDLTGLTTISNTASVATTQLTKPAGPADIQVNQVPNFTTGLTVSSSNANGKANASDLLTYTLRITNTGDQRLTNIKITDPVPTGTDFVSASNGGALQGTAVVINLADLNPGATASVTIEARVKTDLTGLTTISNTASVATTQLTKPVGPADIQVNQVPNFTTGLTVSSSNANGKANASDLLTYILTITNTGDQSLTAIKITDPVPTGTDFVSASNGGALQGAAVVISLPDLNPGATASATIQVSVKTNLTGLTTISNTASIATTQLTKPAGPADIQVNQVPNFTTGLTVSSSNSNGKANAGDLLTYTFTVTNTGDQTLTGVKITDPVPMNTEFESATNGGALSNGEIGFILPNIPPGQSISVTAKVRVKNDLTGVATITNTGVVTTDQATKSVGPVSIDVVQNTDFTTGLTVSSANENGKANADDILTYTLTINNTGDQILTGVVINDPVPPHTDFISVSNGGGLVGNNVVINLPNILPGQTSTVTIQVRVQKELNGVAAITNLATVATTLLTKPAGPVSISVNQNSNFNAVLSVVSSNANGKANAGDVLTYTLNLANTGDQNLTGIKISDPLPAHTEFISATNGGALLGNNIIFNLPDLLAGKNTVVSIQVRVKNDLKGVLSITNKANVETNEADKETNNADIETLKPANDAYVPNAFTPNGDGKNDYFEIFGDAVKSYQMNIYNQWGQLIYQNNDNARGWDGTYKGQTQPNGVYVYYINVKFYDGTETIKKGTVTLLK